MSDLDQWCVGSCSQVPCEAQEGRSMVAKSHNGVRWLAWLAVVALPLQSTPAMAMCAAGPCCCSEATQHQTATPPATRHTCHGRHTADARLVRVETNCHAPAHHGTACRCHPNCQCRLASQRVPCTPLPQHRTNDDLDSQLGPAVSPISLAWRPTSARSVLFCSHASDACTSSDLCITLCRFTL